MTCWVVKGKPSRNDLSEMLQPGRLEDWRTRKPPRAWVLGDYVLFWKSAPALCLIGAGEIVAFPGTNRDGDTKFTLRYLTSPLPTPVSIERLRSDPVVGDASFLKAGPAGTVFPLSNRQAARVAALVLRSNPALPARQAQAFARLMPKSASSRKVPIRSALIIRDPYVSMILDGKKTWEIRGRSTKMRGRIGLIKGGSGTVVGTCDLVDVVGPLTLAQYRRNSRKAGCVPSEIHRLDYTQTFAWVMNSPVRLRRPVAYDHPSGAVIWVTLSPDVVRKLRN